MSDETWLAKQFDGQRTHLRAVAHRMLGNASEADDAVQEAWLKVSRAGASDVANLGGWLTTIVARVCLDMLRARRSRPAVARDDDAASTPLHGANADGNDGAHKPDANIALADAIGPALFVVLDTLAPAERVAFVLHDVFDLSFDEIAPIVERTPAAARQLASRGRRRVRGATAPPSDVDDRRALVDAFLAASRDGDFARLLAVLSPDAVMHADALAVRTAAANWWAGTPLPSEVHGARAVADAFQGRARGATPALIDGEPGAVWAVNDVVRAAFVFVVERARIVSVELLMEPAHIAELHIVRTVHA